MRKWKLLPVFFFAVLLVSCSITNPLSELSWGTATVKGRVTRSFTIPGTTITAVEGVPGALIKTDSGTENAFTNEEGYYSLFLTFRIGSAAKEKKITVVAFDKDNAGKTASSPSIVIRDGLVVVAPPITWAK
ncbi:MAG: hypothetical protein PHX78_12060 [bacterium]|nr:hypothetical protein [bacterium]